MCCEVRLDLPNEKALASEPGLRGAGGQRQWIFTWQRRRESRRPGPARGHSDEALLAHMRAIHVQVKQEYGWPRMHKELLARGIRVEG